METLAITIGILGTSAITAYLGSQFKSSGEGGTKYAAVMKVLFNAIAFTQLLFVPVAGMVIAERISSSGLKTVATTAMIPLTFLYIVFVFYLMWEYLSDLVRVVSGKNQELDSDEFR
jgi:hypothetical protein